MYDKDHHKIIARLINRVGAPREVSPARIYSQG